MTQGQKFQHGDHVKILAEMPPWKSHFTCDEEAVVIASYYEQFGGGDSQKSSYSIHVKGEGEVSWYDDDDLTLEEEKGDIKWIFE